MTYTKIRKKATKTLLATLSATMFTLPLVSNTSIIVQANSNANISSQWSNDHNGNDSQYNSSDLFNLNTHQDSSIVSDYEFELAQRFTKFSNGQFIMTEDAMENLSFEEFNRIYQIKSDSNELVKHVMEYITSTPVSRIGNTFVRYSFYETEEGLFVTAYDATARGLTVITGAVAVISGATRVAMASNALGVFGATFSMLGLTMNKQNHLKPVFSHLGNVLTAAGMVQSNWNTIRNNFHQRWQGVHFEFRSTNATIPNHLRPVQMRGVPR